MSEYRARPVGVSLQMPAGAPIHIVHLEDDELHAELLAALLHADGLTCDIKVVDTERDFRLALASPKVDLVISDYGIPSFSGLAALQICRSARADLPFIFVSGTIGEERAIEALKEGATDYVLKERLGRFVPAVRRALAERSTHEETIRAQREQRDAEERLRRSEAQFRAVAETIPCALFIHHGSNRVYVNRWAERLTGQTRDELLGGPFWDLFHPEDQREVCNQGLTRPGEPASELREWRIRTKDGQDRWVLVSMCGLEFDGYPATLVTAIDVTGRKRAEEALLRQAAALAQTEKLAAMGTLLAGVAHELNNPLAVAAGHAHLLSRSLEGPAATRALKISSATERCARIVKNFLALARQHPPERQWVRLNKVVEEAIELVAYSLTSSGVEILSDLPSDLPLLWADPHQLHQVVVNLVTNAHHALRDHSGPRRLAIGVGRHDDRTLCLEIADSGPGIPAAIVSRVFEPFFTTKAAGEGTGLGLSVCRGIVEGHGGTIRLHTEPGLGTLFVIELPIGPPQALPAPAPVPAPGHATSAARVLVVDDEVELGAMLADLLTPQGHHVDVVTDGRQALDKLAADTYDVILSDVRMPGLDGPALYEEARRLHPGQERRFVFITGDTLTSGTAEFIARAGVPSLAKPFRLDEIERVVNAARAAPRA
jgi:PAS domain S-box-containing protein